MPTTAALLRSIDVIDAELDAMRRVIDDTPGVPAETRRVLLARMHELRTITSFLGAWLSNERVEDLAH